MQKKEEKMEGKGEKRNRREEKKKERGREKKKITIFLNMYVNICCMYSCCCQKLVNVFIINHAILVVTLWDKL